MLQFTWRALPAAAEAGWGQRLHSRWEKRTLPRDEGHIRLAKDGACCAILSGRRRFHCGNAAFFHVAGANPLQQKSGGPCLYRWPGSHFLPRDQGQLCLAGTVQAARSRERGCPPGAASGTVADHNYLAVLRTAAPSAKWSGTTGFASPGGQRSGNRCPESQRLMDPRQLLGDCHQAAPHCAWKGRAPHRQAGTYITTDGTIFGKCF